MKPGRAHWIGLGLAAAASGAWAQMPPPGWQGPADPGSGYLEPPGMRDPREGRVQVQTFLANSPRTAGLGHGPIAIAASASAIPAAAPGGPVAGPDRNSGDGLIETALADQLVHAGYQPGAAGPGQIIEYAVTRDLIQPPEPRHSPVQGGVAVGAGGGSGYHGRGYGGAGLGLGLAIDLSKPLGALVATRIEARISDAATHELLWQGWAEVLARENDKHWRPEILAGRLTAALFKSFPRPTAG